MMECPVCKKEMLEGRIPADRGPLEWYGNCTVRLTKTPFLGVEEAQAFYCPDCRHIILPVPEIEDFFDKLERKVDEVKEKFTAAKNEFMEQREEKQNQKEQKKREGKDPWEL